MEIETPAQRRNDKHYLALYMRAQAERVRLTIEELRGWARDLDRTADRLEEKQEPEGKPNL
jgi:hypothetical protein